MWPFKSAGQRKFEGCEAKKVTSPDGPTTTVICAMTTEDGLTVRGESDESGIKNLRQFTRAVGDAMCGDCVVGKLTLSEFHEYMGEAAEAERRRAIAEYDLAQTRAAMATGTYEPPVVLPGGGTPA